MNEEIMNEIQPVRPKDQFTFSCRQCGACCRNIEGCVMVESLDAYRLARYLRTKGEREQAMLVYRERRMAIMIAAYAALSTKGANQDIIY